MRLNDLADARVAIWGFGREGRAALAAMRTRFPNKKLTLFCSNAEADTLLDRALLHVMTKAPDASQLAQFDVVVKSPGISPYKSPFPEAERAGVTFTSGTALWFADHSHARTIGVTGTKGKSTVSALIAHVLRKSGKCVALAGNIGMPMLDLLTPPREPDLWVIELSSFQIRDLATQSGVGAIIDVGVINNVYEEHLDWHGSRERYVEDKLALATLSKTLVVNSQNGAMVRTPEHARIVQFGGNSGWHVGDGGIYRDAERVLTFDAIPLSGVHNAQNVCAALAAIDAVGEDARTLATHVRTFKALPHRLQNLGDREGFRYINDSISTTPYAAIEALRSVGDESVAIIVGGFDRGVDWSCFVDYVASHPPALIIAMGANGAAIAAALQRNGSPSFGLERVTTLAEAVAIAQQKTAANGVILLSPGAPSFDQFCNYAERGREFARLAGFDPAAITEIEGVGVA